MRKTNAARILDRLGIPYTLREYAVDETDLSAEAAAIGLGLPPEQIFKTLVLRGDKTGVFIVLVPGGCELDLKKAASLSGNKKADLVPLREVQGLTGYIRGGVSPLGMKKSYPVFLDKSAFQHRRIAISAGHRGTQIFLSPGDLQKVTGAASGELTVS